MFDSFFLGTWGVMSIAIVFVELVSVLDLGRFGRYKGAAFGVSRVNGNFMNKLVTISLLDCNRV